jgi:hypothetical protein
MSPEALAIVSGSWNELAARREEFTAQLGRSFVEAGARQAPAARARWLVGAVTELVELLPAPSRIEERARSFGDTWPVTGAAPSFAVDGLAWMSAARRVAPSWTDQTEDAWRRAWLLLSDVLAIEALSPFSTPVEAAART